MTGDLAESASPRTAGDVLSIPTAVVVAGFTALAFVLRSSTFFHSVENWDESQFLLVARSLLDGHAPYTEIWERKPPGIFVLFAVAQLVFGRSVAAIRILGCLAVAASSVLLFLIGRSLKNPTAGLLAGILYEIFSLTYGRPTGLEICFTPFLLFAFYLVLSRNTEELLGGVTLPLGLGFVAGAALQISYLVLFDLSALGLFLLVFLWPSVRVQPARFFRFLGLVAVGPVALFAVAALSFAAAGHFADYLDANVGANFRYVAGSRVDYGRLGVDDLATGSRELSALARARSGAVLPVVLPRPRLGNAARPARRLPVGHAWPFPESARRGTCSRTTSWNSFPRSA